MARVPLKCRLIAAAVAPVLAASAVAQDGPKAPAFPITIAPETTPAVRPASLSGNQQPAYAGRSPGIDPLFRDKQIQIAAYIGTEAIITEDEVWHMVRQRPEMRQAATLTSAERADAERKLYQDELKKIIDRELIIIEMIGRLKKNAKNPDILKELQDHAEKSATRRLADYRKMNKFTSDVEFAEVLKSQGISLKGIRRQLERDALSGIYLEQTLKDKPKHVTLADVWEYYAGHQSEFAVEDAVKWQDLFVSFARFPSVDEAKKHADEVWRQATAGADFPQLVAKYGQGDSNLRGGDGVGTKKGEIQPPELEPVLLEMDAGQVSGLLQTATGFHLVKMVERQKAGVRPFDEKVQIEVRDKLARQVQKAEYDKLMDELWRKHRPKVVEQ
jgi:peptidyl-prolyl cis-trans isomerase SurA